MTTKKDKPTTEGQAESTQPAAPRSNTNWKVTDMTGMSAEERKAVQQAAIDKALQTGQPAKKPGETTGKVHNVSKPNAKGTKKPAKHKESVTSGGKGQEKQEEKRPRGRPSSFTQELADEICERIAEGETLRQICRDERMPHWTTVYAWRASDKAFSVRFAHAREVGFDVIAEECIDIADDTAHDTLVGENGERANTEWISRSKLRIETRLKLLAKWDPKRYGEKVDLNHGGQGDNPIVALLGKISGTALPIASNLPDEDGDE